MTTLEFFNSGIHFKQWIQILLGMDINSGFQAVTIVNGNISRRINIHRGCQQSHPIAGHLLFINENIVIAA